VDEDMNEARVQRREHLVVEHITRELPVQQGEGRSVRSPARAVAAVENENGGCAGVRGIQGGGELGHDAAKDSQRRRKSLGRELRKATLAVLVEHGQEVGTLGHLTRELME